MLVRIAQAPLLHFMLLGGLLFFLQQARDWPPVRALMPVETISISQVDIEQLRLEWRRDSSREPTPEQLRAAIARHVDDEILVREALRLAIDTKDPVVRQRMLLNMRFAYPGTERSESDLLEEARVLGMLRHDLVLRRRLVQVMEQRIVSSVTLRESDLRDYAAKHPERFAKRKRYSFEHVFLAQENTADNMRYPEAEALLRRLQDGMPPAGDGLGDAFLLGRAFPSADVSDIAKALGPDFAEAVTGMETGAWSGPLRSAYGWHLVRVNAVESVDAYEPEKHRTQLAYATLQEVEQRQLRETMRRLRRYYQVEIAGESRDMLAES